MTAAILSFFYFEITIPDTIDDGVENNTLIWTDNAKIDGGTIKGFAVTGSGQTVYAIYQFANADEKQKFTEMDLSTIEFRVTGSFQSVEIPSHPYAFNMEQYLRMYGASGIYQVEKIFSYNINKSFI